MNCACGHGSLQVPRAPQALSLQQLRFRARAARENGEGAAPRGLAAAARPNFGLAGAHAERSADAGLQGLSPIAQAQSRTEDMAS